MPAIKKIINSNPNVEGKVNYFIDRFNHSVSFLGTEWDLDLENQLSLIEKVNFYIENKEYRVDYYENYFSHELFLEDTIWKDYPAFLKLKPYLLQLREAVTKGEKELVIKDQNFQEIISQLLCELKSLMPEVLFKSLMSIIHCRYSIHQPDHIEKLNIISKLIVSEGYFSGKKRMEIMDLVNRIFNKDLNSFPVPLEVRPQNVKQYIQANNLTNQLSGFKTIMQDKMESCFVLMKLYGGHKFPENFYFNYRKVSFYGKMHLKILKLKSSIEQRRSEDFFSDEECIYVVTKIHYFSVDSVVSRMNDATREQIDYLSTSLGRYLNLDDTQNYILLNYRWSYQGYSISTHKHHSFYDFNRLRALKNNPFSILNKIKSSPAKDKLLSCEDLFVQAHKNEKVSMYWQYLEALLPQDYAGRKQIRSLVPDLLLLTEKETIDNRIFSTLLNVIDFFNGGIELLGVEVSDLSKVRNALVKKQIPDDVRNVDYPFVQELVKQFDRQLDKEYFENVKKFYLQILKETYGTRNFNIHAGIQHSKSATKINMCVPRMISRLRWVIFDEIKKYPKEDFNTIIQNLLGQARKYLV